MDGGEETEEQNCEKEGIEEEKGTKRSTCFPISKVITRPNPIHKQQPSPDKILKTEIQTKSIRTTLQFNEVAR
jgi:hypothetical protein